MEKIIYRNTILLEFNVLIIINSMIMGNNIYEGLFLIIEFMIIRTMNGARHYDNIIECLIMTTLTMISIFMILQIHFLLAIIFTYFTAKILSDNNSRVKLSIENIINNGFMWRPSKFQSMYDFAQENMDNIEFKKFEQRLKKHDPEGYEYYDMKVHKGMNYREIEEKMGCDNRKITNQLGKVFKIFNIYFDDE